MDAISQTTFSKAFAWIKMFEFWLHFHWSLFPRLRLITSQHWFRKWLGIVQATSHYLNQLWFVYQRIYVSLCLNELKQKMLTTGSIPSVHFCPFIRKYENIIILYWEAAVTRQAFHIAMWATEMNSLWPSDTTGPDGTNPLPELMLIYHQRCSVAFTREQFHKESSWT